jgi:hypothetical protein
LDQTLSADAVVRAGEPSLYGAEQGMDGREKVRTVSLLVLNDRGVPLMLAKIDLLAVVTGKAAG